jgi:D-3-phosphoglycerate dehydrogenase / 2-oxoglutarate reductase
LGSVRVVITDFGDPDNGPEATVFAASGLDVELIRGNVKSPAEVIPLVRQADAIIVQFATIDRTVIESLERCRIISRYGIGVDMIDIQAASDRGIPVANVPDFCIDEVSTQTVGFIIDLDRHTFALDKHVKSGQWGVSPPPSLPPLRLKGQTLGIVGLGKIGRVVAEKAACLGLHVVASDPFADGESARTVGAELVELPELLRRADYVSLHCPLIPETRGLIGARELAAMKPSAYLINMARGPIVDQRALRAALTNGTIAGAALDVLEEEPPPTDEPLLHLDNVILTPHTSSWSVESLAQLRHDTAQNVVELLQGRWPRSVVNSAAIRR